MINERTFLLTLQSLTRAFLQKHCPTVLMPLAGMEVDTFANTSWPDLGISANGATELANQLRTMFPGLESNPVKVKNWQSPADCACEIFNTWLQGDKSIVYESSGSGGSPKRSPHSLEATIQEVETIAQLFPGIRHIVGLTPQHHSYGFIFGVLLHNFLGAYYRVLPPLPTILTGALANDTLLIGYPGLWANVKTTQNFAGRNIVCLSAGSSWSEKTMLQLQVAGLGLVDIYGASENGAIGYRNKPGDFTLIDYWQKKEGLERQLPSGDKLVFQEQDILAWSTARTFRPLKRLDGAVQVAGINVYPNKVAQTIMTHPLVQECKVRLMRPQEGARLKAFVVPTRADADLTGLRMELKQLCQTRLTTPERPVSFQFGPALPHNNFGKDADWAILRE
jgi:4-coumarate--CoA ligase (photoactive yellow protein activation family)